MLLAPVENCDRLFDGSDGLMSGDFSSPPPPSISESGSLHTYVPARDCLIQFHAPEGKVVWLTWNSFHLEPPLQRIKQYVLRFHHNAFKFVLQMSTRLC